MHAASDDDGAKDNCVACLVKILERYSDQLPENDLNTMFGQVMSAIPLQGDVGENQTILKYIMNVNALNPDKVLPYMDKISLTCLQLLTDTRCRDDVPEPFKVLTAKFLKNVVMECGRADVV